MENRRPPPQNGVIETCHKLLNKRDIIGARLMVHMNQQARKDWHELEHARAICDVLIAAENRLPNGFMDYYGMIRVTRLGPVVLDDFKKLMKLLDGRQNHFPLSQEAAHHALQAWSMLSKPHMKAKYDLAISRGRGKDKTGTFRTDHCPYCPPLHELMTDYKQLCYNCWNLFLVLISNPVPLQQRGGARYMFPNKLNVEVVVISDDDSDESQNIMKMPRPELN